MKFASDDLSFLRLYQFQHRTHRRIISAITQNGFSIAKEMEVTSHHRGIWFGASLTSPSPIVFCLNEFAEMFWLRFASLPMEESSMIHLASVLLAPISLADALDIEGVNERTGTNSPGSRIEGSFASRDRVTGP